MSLKLKNVKLEKTSKFITPYAGLGILHNVILGSYFYSDLCTTFNYMKKRNRGYSPAEKILAHMELILSGGEALSDIKMLENDNGYKKITNQKSLPKQNTFTTFYNSITKDDYDKYEDFNIEQAIKYYKKKHAKMITLDIDSSLSFTEKKCAEWTYEKKKGFNPMYVVDEKNKIILLAKFRNGNASPQSDILESLEKVISELKKAIPGIKIYVRIDSAGYQYKIVKYLTKYNFVIRGDLNVAKRKEFELIHPKEWKKIDDKSDICRITTTISSGPSDFIEVDAIVKREKVWSKEEGYLMNTYTYSYVITNISKYEMDELSILNYYNQRGNGENIFKELKNDFALNNFPSSEYYANGFYLQVVVSTYNIFQISKTKLFKKEWHKHRLKTIRYYIINIAGYIVRSGREIILKLFENYAYYKEFKGALELSYCALL